MPLGTYNHFRRIQLQDIMTSAERCASLKAVGSAWGRSVTGGSGARRGQRSYTDPAEATREKMPINATKLHVHDLSFTSHDLLLNCDAFPNLRNGDLVAIS